MLVPLVGTATPVQCVWRPRLDVKDLGRSNSLGMAAERVGRLEIRRAPERLPLVLDLEGEPWKARSAQSAASGSGSHSDDKSKQPTLGCAAHSRRTAETRHRDRRTHRRQIHCPSKTFG